MKVEGKIALITGGAAGFGKALTQRLLENGAKFVTIVDFDEVAGREAESEFNQKFGDGRVRFIRCDVTNESDLRKSFQDCYDVHGALDIVVNNAGIVSKDHHKTMAVNLVAVMDGMLFANEFMSKEKRSEKGVIVNTGSMAVFFASPYVNFSYTASKHGVIGLTKNFPNSTDGFSKDIRAVAVCPAAVETSLWTRSGFLTKEEQDKLDKSRYVNLREVIDAFMRAIEDEELNGIILKVGKGGLEVIS